VHLEQTTLESCGNLVILAIGGEGAGCEGRYIV
jgi:hypothetical protein